MSSPSPAGFSPPVPTPLELFARWFDEAVVAGLPEPEAMVLATATPDGQPSARVVLCRGIGPQGLRFFTNRQSRKGNELAANPKAAAVFFWQPLGRQVRFEGDIEVLSDDEDDAYFSARPRGHQLAAVASPQSRPIDAGTLLNRFEELQLQYQGQPVPRPAHWGGYRLVPRVIEFWTRRDNRLHDRTVYRLTGGTWQPETIAP
ncbi:MAG TPA: pyridoxamine 5'-phosphate oxidase [Polyangia bacterium]